jgi:hypothetical protein
MRRSTVLAGLLVVAIGVGLVQAAAAAPDLMAGWYSYDYQAGADDGVNVFRPAVPNGGAVWVNHRQWSIDDPEDPPSVLALVRYEGMDTSTGTWVATGAAGEDLRGRCVTFELRGRDLDLDGADVTFWVMGRSQRWHTTLPVRIRDDWQRVTVDIDGADWHNSWSPYSTPSLERTLAHDASYGIGFVDFDEEPSGMLGLRGFRVGC